MVLKTFNVEEIVYKKFSDFCKGHGVSMSKQVEMFMESMIEEEPEAKQASHEVAQSRARAFKNRIKSNKKVKDLFF